jgi:hypothetical protein
LCYGFWITGKYILIDIFFVNTYILYIETPGPNTNRHFYAHKCLHCAGIEPATSCVVGQYSHHYAKSAVVLQSISLSQCISGVSAINPLIAFYDMHGGKREVLFFYFVQDTTRDEKDTIYLDKTTLYLSAVTTLVMDIPKELAITSSWQVRGPLIYALILAERINILSPPGHYHLVGSC